ncbi:hypothetical protein GOP47_0005657 [Adiantum capillus-veneris]|uniref:Uncharacterized protein n=1 Tax=Adiantum capillus-veneris TaxID=13818 RepID=A0A9D4V6P9_ADICA|nr:hypothetical protein GOP47_0005657 [Adiantum capillus-veneris]
MLPIGSHGRGFGPILSKKDFKTALLGGRFDQKACIAEVDSYDEDVTGFTSRGYESGYEDDEDAWSDSSSSSMEDFAAFATYDEDWKAMLDLAYHAEVQDFEDLVEEDGLLSTSGSSEGEVEDLEDLFSL